MGLDFRRATDLFLASEQELAMALGVSEAELRRYRERPREAPDAVLARLVDVLAERGRDMARVGEMLQETAGG
jgi:DNA-binding transcriptional regulator YiaG